MSPVCSVLQFSLITSTARYAILITRFDGWPAARRGRASYCKGATASSGTAQKIFGGPLSHLSRRTSRSQGRCRPATHPCRYLSEPSMLAVPSCCRPRPSVRPSSRPPNPRTAARSSPFLPLIADSPTILSSRSYPTSPLRFIRYSRSLAHL